MESIIAPRQSVRRIERTTDMSTRRQLQVPVRMAAGLPTTPEKTAITHALHHNFETPPLVPPAHATHQASVQQPQSAWPTYHPHSFATPQVLPHYTPVHRSFPFRAALIGIGIGLVALGTYVGFQLVGNASPAHADTKKVPAAVPIDISSQ